MNYGRKNNAVTPDSIEMSMDISRKPSSSSNTTPSVTVRMSFLNKTYSNGGAHRLTNKLRQEVKDAGCRG